VDWLNAPWQDEAVTTRRLTRTLEWRGRTVVWDRFGQGPALVFLHGTPWSSALWRPIADALASRFTVYLWDMPGYGASSKKPEHAVDLGFQGKLFAHLLRTWQLERPHVIAHDFGGSVALRARLLHGARYSSLCLVDVVACALGVPRSLHSCSSTPTYSPSSPPLCIKALWRHTCAEPATEDSVKRIWRCSSTRG
jgi:pimeloyl-ACP methyl ester carboxylesterase